MKNQIDASVLISEDWHANSTESAFTFLETSIDGLDQAEVEKRLEQYGTNQLPETQTRSAFLRFIYQFHNILIYVLLAAGIVTAILEHWVDSGVIFAVVFLNAVIGFVQEGKAENALISIQQMLSPRAIVIRNGRQITIQA